MFCAALVSLDTVGWDCCEVFAGAESLACGASTGWLLAGTVAGCVTAASSGVAVLAVCEDDRR